MCSWHGGITHNMNTRPTHLTQCMVVRVVVHGSLWLIVALSSFSCFGCSFVVLSGAKVAAGVKK